MCSRCDKLTLIQSLIGPLDFADVISTTQDSCVVIAPTAHCASIAADLLLSEAGIISKTIRGHFIDAFYILIRYDA